MASNAGKVARRLRIPAVLAASTSAPEPVVIVTPAKELTMDAASQTADQAQTVLNDATERARTGFAKGQAMFADMGEFGKGNVEALVESSKIAARGLETLGQGAAAFMRGQFEDAQAQARTLATVTSPTDFFKLQGDFMRSSFEKIVAETSRGTEMMLKMAGEVAQPISNRVALAADKMKVAA
jgi:phasin family protein